MEKKNDITKKELSDRDVKFFNIAKKISLHNTTNRRYYIGCIATLNGKILSTGYNRDKTSPVQARYEKYSPKKTDRVEFKSYLHAEVDCLKNIENEDIPWHRVKLYIYRSCKSREHGIARPCPQCMKMIKDLGIQTIYYTTDLGYSKEILY